MTGARKPLSLSRSRLYRIPSNYSIGLKPLFSFRVVVVLNEQAKKYRSVERVWSHVPLSFLSFQIILLDEIVFSLPSSHASLNHGSYFCLTDPVRVRPRHGQRFSLLFFLVTRAGELSQCTVVVRSE